MRPAKQGVPGEAVAIGVKLLYEGEIRNCSKNFEVTQFYWAYLGKQWEVCLMDRRKFARRIR